MAITTYSGIDVAPATKSDATDDPAGPLAGIRRGDRTEEGA